MHSLPWNLPAWPYSLPRIHRDHAAVGLCALLLLLAAAPVGAQTVSPGSITRDPSATCGGGSESVGDACITLPEDATCNTVDVFLLFDDTGSFQKNVAKTGKEFIKIVDRLQDEFPAVSFAFGVGRFEEYGGLGRSFSEISAASPEDRPFILNQALLETIHPDFSDLLDLALGDTSTKKDVREAPGFGGDPPETAIEALFQAATGLGFDGDGNGSVLGSGPAGAELTQVRPGASGDVPAFSSYQGEHSGALGGVGWRASSCQRLVLLATDACPVAPFEPPTIPASVVGAGAEVPSAAFDCGFGLRDRFGFPGLAKSPSTGDTDAVAPQGAATVPATIEALNDLGIQVIGLGDGTPPSNLTGPSSNQYVFLGALAELTGAVDRNGDPLIFDLGGNSTEIQDAIVAAVQESLTAPIDVALVPDPELSGLTVTASPPVQEDVRPGDTVCFAVDLEGDDSFEGGSFGLDFVDTASNGSLGMRVPVNLRCPDCFDLVTRSLLCETDGSGFSGSYEWTFILRNRTDDDIHHLFFVDLPENVTIEPQHLTFSPPIRRNQRRLVTVKIEDATPGTPLDFRITLHDAAIDQCCAEEVRLELPECDCAQLRVDRNPSCFRGLFSFSPGPPWRYTFDLENLTTVPVEYLLLSPVSPTDPDHLTPVPPSELVIDRDVLLLDSTLGVGDETGLIPVEISGPAARQGEQACFRISTHDTTFRQCCSIVKCFTFPDCSFGAVDFESMGGATLTRSGTALFVTDIGSSGEDGVAGDFGPSGDVEISLQDFSAGVPLREGAFVRLGGLGTVEGQEQEVVNVVATLAQGQVHVLPDRGAPSLQQVLVLREGEVVAACEQSGTVAAVDGEWPTGFVMQDDLIGFTDQSPQLRLKDLITSNNVAGITWPTATLLQVRGCGSFEGDQALFAFDGSGPVDGFTGTELTAAEIPTVVIKGFHLNPVDLTP